MLMILGSIHDEEKCNRLEALYNDHCSSMYTVAYRKMIKIWRKMLFRKHLLIFKKS